MDFESYTEDIENLLGFLSKDFCYSLLSFSVLSGIPIPLQRPRFRTAPYYAGRCPSFLGRSSRILYDPQKKAKHRAQQELGPQAKVVLKKVDLLRLIFLMPIPKSLSQKKQALLVDRPHTQKPDLSNLIKFVEDVSNGILFTDDAIINAIFAEKRYAKEPKTIIKIYEVV